MSSSRWRARASSLGLISNTGTETAQSLRGDLLEDAELLPFFRGHMLLFSSVEGLDKSDPAVLPGARATRPASPRCLFVGESEAERAVAEGQLPECPPSPAHSTWSGIPRMATTRPNGLTNYSCTPTAPPGRRRS